MHCVIRCHYCHALCHTLSLLSCTVSYAVITVMYCVVCCHYCHALCHTLLLLSCTVIRCHYCHELSPQSHPWTPVPANQKLEAKLSTLFLYIYKSQKTDEIIKPFIWTWCLVCGVWLESMWCKISLVLHQCTTWMHEQQAAEVIQGLLFPHALVAKAERHWSCIPYSK